MADFFLSFSRDILGMQRHENSQAMLFWLSKIASSSWSSSSSPPLPPVIGSRAKGRPLPVHSQAARHWPTFSHTAPVITMIIKMTMAMMMTLEMILIKKDDDQNDIFVTIQMQKTVFAILAMFFFFICGKIKKWAARLLRLLENRLTTIPIKPERRKCSEWKAVGYMGFVTILCWSIIHHNMIDIKWGSYK